MEAPTTSGRDQSGPYLTGNKLPDLQFIVRFVGAQFIAPATYEVRHRKNVPRTPCNSAPNNNNERNQNLTSFAPR
jgi:hypothetical protein